MKKKVYIYSVVDSTDSSDILRCSVFIDSMDGNIERVVVSRVKNNEEIIMGILDRRLLEHIMFSIDLALDEFRSKNKLSSNDN